ncbi:response regulator [Rapidithrix thailandica]|uniref:Response regulator n=1 Tax=Rapidithrix thailandica TaxID=413964 RepID=A0AAW9SAK7_9BACT
MTQKNYIPVSIVYADDDPEDRMLAKDALEESRILNPVNFVEDGEELMEYLQNKGKYQDRKKYPTPALILLDLNMPKKNGIDVLKEMKKDDKLKKIPVVVLTTSSDREDIQQTYELGVSSFITKPVTFDGLVEIMKTLGKYWFEVVALPETKQLHS